MKATLVAFTHLTYDALDILPIQPGVTDPEHLVEFAGRACYQSWDRPNPETALTGDYIRKNAIEKGHGSILEHASATFYLTGVSRSLTHELIRHRAGTAFSELSQRYVDVADVEFVMPPAFRKLIVPGAEGEAQAAWNDTWSDIRTDYSDGVDMLIDAGLPRKQAREAARCVMPNAAETKIVMTANFRAWRHILRLRGSKHADAEIRELALELLNQLYEVAPAVFADLDGDVTTLSDGREVIA